MPAQSETATVTEDTTMAPSTWSGLATPGLDECLQQLGELTAALEEVGNARAREAATVLLRLLLELHRVALARLTATMAAADKGPALIELAVADPHVRAALLLHRLHGTQRIAVATGLTEIIWPTEITTAKVSVLGTS